MKKALLLIVAVTQILTFTDVQAYSASDYDPQYTPYNFSEADDARLCRDAVEAFDSDYDALTKSYTENLTQVILSSGVQGSLNNVNAWLEANEFYYSNVFRECIAEDLEQEEVEAKEKARERFEEEQQAKLLEAVKGCDMEYLENLSDKDKMATYDERMACKEKLAAETDQVSEPTPVAIPVYIPPVTTSIPEQVSYTAPVVPVADVAQPVVQEKRLDNESLESSEGDLATSSLATTSEKLIEMTEEELNRLVEERVAAAFEETASEPEPEKTSVFRRIINFFTGWF